MFRKMIVISLFAILGIHIAVIAEAFYSDQEASSLDSREDASYAETQKTYEDHLGLVPEKNALDPSGDSISNYEIEQSIINIKREKKKIIQKVKAKEIEDSQKNTDKGEKFQKDLQRVRDQAEAKKKKESTQKKVIIIQALFLVLCIGTIWFIKSRSADS